MQYPERYTWTGTIANLCYNIRDNVKPFSEDIYWTMEYVDLAEDSHGTIVFRNKKDPKLTIVLSLFYNGNGYYFRLGVKDYSVDPPRADVHNTKGHTYEIPTNSWSYNYNVTYDWDLITTEENIVLLGYDVNYQAYCYDVAIYLGRLKPYEVEDSAIANDFIGVFPHMPMAVNNSDWTYYHDYNVGQGIVRKSRNATELELYQFSTDSQVRSPGVGGRYYVNPFLVFHPAEGVRGEFWGVKTCAFKDSTQHPDGTILDLGTNKYYVVHVRPFNNPTNENYGSRWYTSGSTLMYARPYFFDSQRLWGSGQRALLIQVEGE